MKQQVVKIVFLFLLSIGALEVYAQKDGNYEKAAQAYSRGDYKTAISLYNKSLASGIDNYRTLVGRAEF